ncbi:MAG TPA: class I SAM-dependent methyltransferase [Candidatus Acidoferrum sp.]
MATVNIPADLKTVLNDAWETAQKVPGHLGEHEARLLGLFAACVPATGTIVEIGSFKGRSTVMLAKVASHYSLGPVVAIDPHNSPILLDHQVAEAASSYPDFLNSIKAAGVFNDVEPQVAYSAQVAATWSRPIRLLWIDGDHSYEGAKQDLNGFLPHLVPSGVLAFHDALNAFPGPIRVFAEDEDVLGSDRIGSDRIDSDQRDLFSRSPGPSFALTMVKRFVNSGRPWLARLRVSSRLWKAARNFTESQRDSSN